MFRGSPHRVSGFTLVETMIAVALVAITGTAVITAILVARQWAEYDKQRLAAVAVARRYLEERRREPYAALTPVTDAAIDNFNTPDTGDDLMAMLTVQLYHVHIDGTRGSELTATPNQSDGLLEAVITISWSRTASLSAKRVSETLRTYAYPDM